MRKSKAATLLTRDNVVGAASATLRRNGIAATGPVERMAGVGPIRGGFYRHFASNEQAVAEAGMHAAAGALTLARLTRDDSAPTMILQQVRSHLPDHPPSRHAAS